MKTIIEVNGRKYDATTGKLLETDPLPVAAALNKKPAFAGRGIVMDGVRHQPKPPDKPVQHLEITYKIPATTPALKLQQSPPELRRTSNKTEKARTLLRSIVHKPSRLNTSARDSYEVRKIDKLVQPESNDKNFFKIPTKRLARARQTAHIMSITKFSNSNLSQPKLDPNLQVAKPPKKIFTAPETAPFLNRSFFKSKKKPQVFNHTVAQTTNHKVLKLPKQKLLKRIAKKMHLRPKILAIGVAILAIIVLGGFLAYQNVPTIAMQIADNRAGFSGHLPSTVPVGFSFKGPPIYSKGNISLNYKSNSDNRRFTINQKPTQWSSESLVTDFLINSKLNYQTYNDKGLTIYVYGEGYATWVDNGVWYNITGQGSLSTDQILAIAGSM